MGHYSLKLKFYKVSCLGIVLIMLLAITCNAQKNDQLQESFRLMGHNLSGIKQLLDRFHSTDRQKYHAARFLVDNLRWNCQYFQCINKDPRVDSLFSLADKKYWELVKQKKDTELVEDSFNHQVLAKKDQAFRKQVESNSFTPPTIEEDEYSDSKHITADFLEKQIEHAFELRERLPWVKKMRFEDFCEYILPYRASDASLAINAKEYAHIYSKYLHTDTCTNVRRLIWRYNLTANRLRYWGGKYPYDMPCGITEMFFLGYHDCMQIADFCTNILRACGLPAAIEYNSAYKFWNGRHYHVSIPTEKGWETFSPESELPTHRNPKFYESLNIYRIHFSIQKNNPFSLKNTEEIIPENLSDPRIEDVTREIGDVSKIQLPFNHQTKNRLAYLATFVSDEIGLLPVTWGVIDRQAHNVTFYNVVDDNLYFPIFLDEEGNYHSFSNPFIKTKQTISTLKQDSNLFVNVVLKRKFPRKPAMRRLAEKLPGTCIIASDSPDFVPADTLAIINTIPDTDWEEIEINPQQPYQYYRIVGTGTPQRVYLSEIRFITDRKYNYPNTMDLPDIKEKNPDQVWLLDEPYGQCCRKAEYDGNPQTAPDSWPDVTLKLHTAQYVTKLRYMIKHADNAIKEHERYSLYAWDDGFWKCIQKFEGKEFLNGHVKLKKGQLYWIRCSEQGHEELPFYINDQGIQIFPHEPFIMKFDSILQGKN